MFSTGLEIVETSQTQSVQIWQGASKSIYCQADALLDFCKWQKDDFECRVSTGEETECEVCRVSTRVFPECEVFTASLDGDKPKGAEAAVKTEAYYFYQCMFVSEDFCRPEHLNLKSFQTNP